MTFLPLLWSETGDSRRRRAGAKAFGDLDLAIRHLPPAPGTPHSSVSRKRLPRWVTLIADPAAATRTACRQKHCTLLVLREPGHGLRHRTVTWGQPSGTRSHAGQRLNRLPRAIWDFASTRDVRLTQHLFTKVTD